MGEEQNLCKAHVVVLPFPSQGHLNPMLQFSKRLASKGIKVTLAIPLIIANSIHQDPGRVLIQPFSDGWDEGRALQIGDIEAYVEKFRTIGFQNLSKLIEGYKSTEYPVKCLVYDSVVPWALDFAKQLGLMAASFFTQSAAVCAICYNIQCGLLSLPIQESTVSLSGLPLLRRHELPSFVNDLESHTFLLQIALDQFSDIDKMDWLLFNTFDKLESEVMNWMAKQWPMKMLTIGPTIPPLVPNSPADTSDCIKWLNKMENKSVVYVSFGTLAKLQEDHMEELAWGLRKSGTTFLWVVRESENEKLPKEFKQEIVEKGLVVTWCPQAAVLGHPAVGCFLSHCGWNSTLEALSCGVPMVAMPQLADQTTNAKFVEDVWGVGVRAKIGERGLVEREEVERCIRDVMEGEKREEINKNAVKWKESAKEAMDKGGSSDYNIDKFVDSLLSTK